MTFITTEIIFFKIYVIACFAVIQIVAHSLLELLLLLGKHRLVDFAVLRIERCDLRDQLVVRGLGAVHAFPGEYQGLAVVGLEAEEAVDHGIVALAFQQGHRQELALGLGHFAGIGVQMVDMEPVVAPLVAQVALGLGDLVGVVGEGIVDAAAVDVQILAQVLHGDAGALDVPAGIAHAPGRIPLQRLILELRLGEP